MTCKLKLLQAVLMMLTSEELENQYGRSYEGILAVLHYPLFIQSKILNFSTHIKTHKTVEKRLIVQIQHLNNQCELIVLFGKKKVVS